MPGLLASLGLNWDKFRNGMDEAKARGAQTGHELADTFGNKLSNALSGVGLSSLVSPLGLVTAGVGLFTAALKKNFDQQREAREIEIGAQRLGVTAERFQDLSRSAERSGTSIEAVYAAYRKLAQGSILAENGNKEMAAAFAALGISVDQLKGKSVDEIFSIITRNSAGAKLGIEQVAAIMKTMGRSADELLPALQRGSFNNVDIFKPNNATIKARAELFENWKSALGEIKSFATYSITHFPVISQLIDGINAGVSKFGGIARRLHGTDEAESGVDLLTTTAAQLKAEQDADHQKLESANRVHKLEDELATKRRRNAMEGMTTAEKIVALKKEEAEIQATIKATGAVGGVFAALKGKADTSAEDKVKLEMELEDRKHERIRLEKQQMAEGAREEKREERENRRENRFHAPDVNALQKIGGYVSPEATMMRGVAEKHLQISQEALNQLREIARTQSRTEF